MQQAVRSIGGVLGGAPVTGDSTPALGVVYGQILRQASAMSFIDLFHLLGVLFLCMTPLVWMMQRPRQHARPGRPAVAAAHE